MPSLVNVASSFLKILPLIKSNVPAGGSYILLKMVSNPEMLTERELEEVTAVFKSFETGLREATIDPKVRALREAICLYTFTQSPGWVMSISHKACFMIRPAMKLNYENLMVLTLPDPGGVLCWKLLGWEWRRKHAFLTQPSLTALQLSTVVIWQIYMNNQCTGLA